MSSIGFTINIKGRRFNTELAYCCDDKPMLLLLEQLRNW